MRLIDADALILEYRPLLTRAIEEGDAVLYTHCKSAVFALKSSPTISPDSLRPKGTWVGEADGYADGELVYDVWYCSECNHCIDDGTDNPKMLPNFCPQCGADMRGEGNGIQQENS